MTNQLSKYLIKDWVVLGRTYFKPPFKISDSLINEARIVHVVNGHSNLYAANQYTQLQDGDTVIMKSDNFINNWSANDSENPNEVIVFQLSSDMLKHIYQNQLPSWFNEEAYHQIPPIQKQENHFLLKDYFNNLRFYLDNPQLISEDLLRIKIQDLLLLLVNKDVTGGNKKILASLYKANEYKFQEVIQTHLFEDLNLEDLAFLTGLSLSSFKRKFSSVYSTSPNKYIVSKRLEKAQLLLRTTDQRISTIAYNCGYSDLGYFTKTFQKHYQCSPTNFRETRLN